MAALAAVWMHSRARFVRVSLLLVAFVANGVAPATSAHADQIDWKQVEREAADMLSEYIRIDTTNPPGNEIAAAGFLADRFRREQIEVRLFEPQEKRGSILARLKGSGSQPPVVLLNHLDVVPASPEGWEHPPFAGVIDGAYVHGRGALDSKGLAVIEAMALIVLKRSGTKLSRDVIFLGTADEEAGGAAGAGWFVDQRFDDLGGPAFVLNEGGAIRERPDGKRAFEVAVSEKTPLWIRVTARGEPGHGSTPRGESAVARLVRALERVREFEPEVRVVPEVDTYFRALSALYEDPKRSQLANLSAALEDPEFREELLAEPRDAALVRNTISMTVLRGSNKANVIPAEASAELDCRLLPGEDPRRFLDRLRDVIGDEGVELEVLLSFPPSSSTPDTVLYRAIEEVASREGLPVVPAVLRGFTDSHYFREKGVVSYGFIPVLLTEEDERTMHGLNERISLENLREGTRRLVEILRALDGSPQLRGSKG